MTTTATPSRQAAVVTPPRQDRRVTFLDYNSDEEEERSKKGFEDRKKRKEHKRQLAEMEEEPSDSKLEECFAQLMKEHSEQRLVNIVDHEVSEHPAVQATSVLDFRISFTHLCTAAGVSSRLQTTGEKVAWLRAKTYKKVKHREYVKYYLRHLVTNRCYKMHFTFASDPPSVSDTSSEKRKGRQSLMPKSWAKRIFGWLKRSKEPALGDGIDYVSTFLRVADTESHDSGDARGNLEGETS